MKYELTIFEQYLSSRWLSFEFDDIDEMMKFVKQVIEHSLAAVKFEFKTVSTGE